jgi:molybdopterin/thiamine biosynthesis adenylyltransferase
MLQAPFQRRLPANFLSEYLVLVVQAVALFTAELQLLLRAGIWPFVIVDKSISVK